MYKITKFEGEYAFLNMMFNTTVEFEGLKFQNAEAAYQAAKSDDFRIREIFCDKDAYMAKVMGETVKLREDWIESSRSVLRRILLDKFTRNSVLKHRLLKTGKAILIDDNNPNNNLLGNLLMEVRTEIRLGNKLKIYIP